MFTAYRPDPVLDPDFEGFHDNLVQFGALTGKDVSTWDGYLAAHRTRRAFFASPGATSTDHGHPTAFTADLDPAEAAALYENVATGPVSAQEAELFRGQMLTEMAGMSLDDGLTMQLHPGSFRNHNERVFERFGRDNGARVQSAVLAMVETHDPALAAWIAAEGALPQTMVDRIGARDEGMVKTEPFTQWVIEGRFVARVPTSPRWASN